MNSADFVWSILIVVLSLILTILMMPTLINYFREKQLGQITREEGPSWHHVKEGTPTMGGLGFLLAGMIAYFIGIITTNNFTMDAWMIIIVLLFFAMIGFLDDYRILILKHNEGLTSRQKFILQVAGGIIFTVFYLMSGQSIALPLPFIGSVSSYILFILFAVFWIVGFSNAVNLTDGLDGLSSSTAIIAFLAFAIIALSQGNSAVLYFCVAMVGGLLGFLMFNKKPAQIFMGDVGSLALGASLAAVSILLKAEWYLLLIGLPFVVETASVILQVAYFKRTGKRIFKMSPIHHHFEMSGYSEGQVVLGFSIFGIICAAVALLIYFI